MENARRHIDNRIQIKQNNFGVKYGNRNNITEKPNGYITKNLQGLEKSPEAEMRLEPSRETLKKVPNWKTPVHDGTHGFRF